MRLQTLILTVELLLCAEHVAATKTYLPYIALDNFTFLKTKFSKMEALPQLIEDVKKVAQIQIKEAMFEEVCTNQNSWLKWKKKIKS